MLLTQAQLQYQISPIFLVGGYASNLAGGMLPIISLLNPEAFDNSANAGSLDNWQLEDAFAIFSPVVGGSLVTQTIAKYPFANVSVAANAIIREPINISLVMATPMKSPQAWENKLNIMTGLKNTLDLHNNAGGTYVVCTPAFMYQNALMIDLVDVSIASSPVPQNAWRWDFEIPLVTLADAAGALSNLMQLITVGVNTTGAITSPATVAGATPTTGNAGAGAGGSTPAIPSTPGSATFEPSGTDIPGTAPAPSGVS